VVRNKKFYLAMYAYHQLHREMVDSVEEPRLADSFFRSWLANGRDGLVSLQDIPYALDDAYAVMRALCADPEKWGSLVHIGA
jgi:hypothetical protein